MDPQNAFELDNMETKNHYRLRSSLKKRKSKNPLGSLDITEVNVDTSLTQPPRRVSFAASNSVKPFLDDPEKNTIWDNTYEEEVNHTDSTTSKSENTNPTNLSELKHPFQESNYVGNQKECVPPIYCDQGVEDMEVSCFDQTMINDKIRNVLDESNLDSPPCSFANIDVKNTINLTKDTTLNTEPTSNDILHKEVTTMLGNFTVRQEEDMSMTCCFGNAENMDGSFPNNRAQIVSQLKENKKSSAGIPKGTHIDDKENRATVYTRKEKASLSDQSGMEFTCAFSNNILERVNQTKGAKHNSLAVGFGSTNVRDKENIAPVYTSKENAFFPDQSVMEFTCAFSNNIVERVNLPKEAEHNSLAMGSGYTNVKDKENIATVCAANENVCLLDQSGMEFTCAFSNSILEKVKQPKQEEYSFLAMGSGYTNVRDKENIATVNARNENVCLPDQSGMEFTCAFSNNILEKAKQAKEAEYNSLTMGPGYTNGKDKENIATVSARNENVCVPDQSGMEFTCAFSNNILEKVKQPKQAEHSSLAMGSGYTNVTDKENIATVNTRKENICLPDQSGMEFTCAFSNNILEKAKQPKEAEHNSLTMGSIYTNVKDKENIATVYARNENVCLPDQSGMEFTCAFSKNILDTVSQPKGAENNSLAMKAGCSNVRDKENIATVCTKKEEVFLPDQSGMEFTCGFSKNILEKVKQPKEAEHNSLAIRSGYTNVRDKENIATAYSSKENVFLPHQSGTEFTCAVSNKILERVNQPKGAEHNSLAMGADIREAIYENCKSVPTKSVAVEHKVKTDIKPVKVREFGNIPIAVDVTDLSIDQNINNRDKPVNNTNRQDCGLKETTYSISTVPPEKKSVKINEDTFIHEKVNVNSTSHNEHVNSKIDLNSLNEGGENTVPKNVLVDDAVMQSIDPSNIISEQNILNMREELNLKENCAEPVFPEKTMGVGQIFEEKNIINQGDITKNTNIDKYKINYSNERKQADEFVTKECFLLDSMEPSDLINSINLSDEDAVGINFVRNDTSVSKEDRKHTMKGSGRQLGENVGSNKVIYSEPMKEPMQTSGMNTFHFISIASIEEDTQQLIQATFSKSKTEQFENTKSQSGFLSEPNMLENDDKNDFNKTRTTALENETLNTEFVFKNIHKKVVRSNFQTFNYKKVADSITTHQEIRDKMEKLLRDCKFPDIPTFSLQEETKKMSLGNVSSDGNSSESVLDNLECGEDNNCNKSMLEETNKTLQEKIVNVCKRSNNTLNIKYSEEYSYIFSAVNECVLIYVNVHPKDGRVTEIKSASSLDNSFDILIGFLVKKILDKLKESTLESYLGRLFDILSLLDHICLTVDEVMDFYVEFLSLQKLYPSLRINSDNSISFEVLHTCPPVWWTIRLSMTSVTKISTEGLHLESKWANINKEHIIQILRNINEGVGSLRSFICSVYQYFERTQIRLQPAH